MPELHETVAALATAPGKAGVAIVRLSGTEAFGIAARVAGRPIRPGMQFVRLAIDDCVVLGFKGPKSYTGEDVVEFQCHGGTVTPRRILEALFAAGARLARRGEFTERAFLNGKLDYDQAESVLDLINAKTTRAAEAARAGLAGRRARELRGLYEQALDLSTRLEHTLDVDEDDLPPDFAERLRGAFAGLRTSVLSALRQLQEGRILREGALVVLAGPPNAGKSSLLNALLDEQRAIVSDVPGTTRDSIEAWLDLDGYPVRLVDTAGIRATEDRIEAEGVRRSEDLIARAQIVLSLAAADAPGVPDPHRAAAGEVLRVLTKSDLLDGRQPPEGVLSVSSRTGEGLDGLRRAIVAALERLAEKTGADAGDDEPEGEVQATLLSIGSSLQPFVADDGAARDPVLAANAARQAADRLGALIGATYSEDLLDRLFSRFCVGK